MCSALNQSWILYQLGYSSAPLLRHPHKQWLKTDILFHSHYYSSKSKISGADQAALWCQEPKPLHSCSTIPLFTHPGSVPSPRGAGWLTQHSTPLGKGKRWRDLILEVRFTCQCPENVTTWPHQLKIRNTRKEQIRGIDDIHASCMISFIHNNLASCDKKTNNKRS